MQFPSPEYTKMSLHRGFAPDPTEVVNSAPPAAGGEGAAPPPLLDLRASSFLPLALKKLCIPALNT